VSDSYEFIIHQVLLGVPMLLTGRGSEWSVLDVGDYEHLLRGGILKGDADCVLLLLNPVYGDQRRMYKGTLPEGGDMGKMLDLMCGTTTRRRTTRMPRRRS